MAKAAFNKKAFFTSKLDVSLRKQTSKVLNLECSFVWG